MIYKRAAAERVEGGYKATSSARLLSAMRRFFYLYREKYREDDPSAQLASLSFRSVYRAQVERSCRRRLLINL